MSTASVHWYLACQQMNNIETYSCWSYDQNQTIHGRVADAVWWGKASFSCPNWRILNSAAIRILQICTFSCYFLVNYWCVCNIQYWTVLCWHLLHCYKDNNMLTLTTWIIVSDSSVYTWNASIYNGQSLHGYHSRWIRIFRMILIFFSEHPPLGAQYMYITNKVL